jgi:hypothetical protein
LSAFLALRAKNRAFRCKSSDLPMQILWAFRCNPWRAQRAGTGFAENLNSGYTQLIAAGN